MKTKNIGVGLLVLMTMLIAATPVASAHEERCNLGDVKCHVECNIGHLTTPFPHGCVILDAKKIAMRALYLPITLFV